MKEILLIETGVANIASVTAAFSRLKAKIVLSSSVPESELPENIINADYVVLPGVGSFAAGMAGLRNRGLDAAIIQRARFNRPLLTICLGLQLLFEESEESPGTSGLGIFPGAIARLPTLPSFPLPHLSWSRVRPHLGFEGVPESWAYFAHSYAVKAAPQGSEYLVTEYGEEFIAGFRLKTLLACQFHPELSGRFGLSLLREWIS